MARKSKWNGLPKHLGLYHVFDGARHRYEFFAALTPGELEKTKPHQLEPGKILRLVATSTLPQKYREAVAKSPERRGAMFGIGHYNATPQDTKGRSAITSEVYPRSYLGEDRPYSWGKVIPKGDGFVFATNVPRLGRFLERLALSHLRTQGVRRVRNMASDSTPERLHSVARLGISLEAFTPVRKVERALKRSYERKGNPRVAVRKRV